MFSHICKSFFNPIPDFGLDHGYLFTVIYTLFLALLMTALTAKILFMARAGAPVIPVIFIIPTINGIAVLFSVALLRNVKTP